VTTIGGSAFYNCESLTSATIGNGVTIISNNLFSYCSSLTSVTLGNSVTGIDEEVFAYCFSLTSITLPNSITIINDSNNLYEAEEIKKWNDLAFKFYNHDPDKLEGVHHTAYTTLLSSKESRHYNSEKCLKNIHGRKSSTFISIYYYCLCYERLNRYEELKNEIGRVLNSINKNIYFESDREYYRKIFEPIIKRMEKREKYGD
jgi:hypothetical protein